MRDKLMALTGKGHLSYSSVKYALQDMALWEMYMKGQLKPKTQALSFGSVYDCILFTPEDFDKRFLVIDDKAIKKEIGGTRPTATAKYKKWMEDLEALQDGVDLVSAADVEKAKTMLERLESTGVKQDYLSGEYQFEFNECLDTPSGEVPLRGFLDCKGFAHVSDSKTTQKLEGFKYDVYKYGYDIQAHIYTKITGIDTYYWVVQEKAYPYAIGVYKASDKVLASGERKFNKAVETIQQYLNGGVKTSKFFIYGEI